MPEHDMWDQLKFWLNSLIRVFVLLKDIFLACFYVYVTMGRRNIHICILMTKFSTALRRERRLMGWTSLKELDGMRKVLAQTVQRTDLPASMWRIRMQPINCFNSCNNQSVTCIQVISITNQMP